MQASYVPMPPQSLACSPRSVRSGSSRFARMLLRLFTAVGGPVDDDADLKNLGTGAAVADTRSCPRLSPCSCERQRQDQRDTLTRIMWRAKGSGNIRVGECLSLRCTSTRAVSSFGPEYASGTTSQCRSQVSSFIFGAILEFLLERATDCDFLSFHRSTSYDGTLCLWYTGPSILAFAAPLLPILNRASNPALVRLWQLQTEALAAIRL